MTVMNPEPTPKAGPKVKITPEPQTQSAPAEVAYGAIGSVTQEVAAAYATGQMPEALHRKRLDEIMDDDLRMRALLFTEPQQVYGRPLEAAKTIRDLIELVRDIAR